jgi:hypothetical protein
MLLSFQAFIGLLGMIALFAGLRADVPDLDKEPGISGLVTGSGTLLVTVFSLLQEYPKTALILWLGLSASLAMFVEPKYTAHVRDFDQKRTKKGKTKGKKGKRK